MLLLKRGKRSWTRRWRTRNSGAMRGGRLARRRLTLQQRCVALDRRRASSTLLLHYGCVCARARRRAWLCCVAACARGAGLQYLLVLRNGKALPESEKFSWQEVHCGTHDSACHALRLARAGDGHGAGVFAACCRCRSASRAAWWRTWWGLWHRHPRRRLQQPAQGRPLKPAARCWRRWRAVTALRHPTVLGRLSVTLPPLQPRRPKSRSSTTSPHSRASFATSRT